MVKFDRKRFVQSFDPPALDYAFRTYCWHHSTRYETFEDAFWFDDAFFDWFLYTYLPSVYNFHASYFDDNCTLKI